MHLFPHLICVYVTFLPGSLDHIHTYIHPCNITNTNHVMGGLWNVLPALRKTEFISGYASLRCLGSLLSLRLGSHTRQHGQPPPPPAPSPTHPGLLVEEGHWFANRHLMNIFSLAPSNSQTSLFHTHCPCPPQPPPLLPLTDSGTDCWTARYKNDCLHLHFDTCYFYAASI